MRFRQVTLFAVAVASLAELCACGGTQGSPSSTDLSIYPASAEVDLGQQMRFETSTPADTPSWSVVEPDGGVIDTSGAYTAPAAEGTYHVMARFGAALRTKTAEVRVKRGVRVSVTPQTASIATGASLTLTATVTGTTNGGVTWSVSEGPDGGTVSADGAYLAPTTAGTFHVVATSTANPARSDYATITVTAPTPPPPPNVVAVAVAPTTASIATGATLQLTAAVTGASNTAVTWSVQEGSAGGSVSSTGLYTAPSTAGTYHVVATSSADSSRTAAATVTVTAPPPTAVVAVAVSPTTASVAASGTQQFKAAVTGSTNTAVAWSVQEGAAGGSVNSTGLYTAPATAGTYHVVATSAADPSKTAAATVTVTAPPAPPPPTTGTTPPDSGTVGWAPASSDTSFVNVKNYGAVGDGVTDDTAAFNAAAATGKKLFVPKPSAFYKLTGRITLLNSIYGDGSMPEFRMFGATGDRAHAMLFVSGHSGSTQLVIQGLTLDGQWNGGSQGEWSANIDIRGASANVLVQYNTLKNPYGDCVMLADDVVGPVTNITIRKNTMVNPYRCDVSFQWVDGVVVDGNSFNKNNTYVDALDVEPCGGTPQYDNNIQITNNVFDIPISRTLSLVNGSGYGGSNITVSGNSGSAQDKPIWDSGWNNVNIANNTWTIKYP